MTALQIVAMVLLTKEKNVTVETHLQRSDHFYHHLCHHYHHHYRRRRRRRVRLLEVVRCNLHKNVCK